MTSVPAVEPAIAACGCTYKSAKQVKYSCKHYSTPAKLEHDKFNLARQIHLSNHSSRH